jgi:diguanylate cyclase (GGDEF)-like protein/PAS domain S-box-containing protein
MSDLIVAREPDRVETAIRQPVLPGADPLSRALLDSRQRWRDLVTLAADLVFETDAEGRLVFVSPDPAIGWPASLLVGQAADQLLADPEQARIFNPFRPTGVVRRRPAWLRRPDGDAACVSFSVTPLFDADRRVIGARGIGQDMSERDGADFAVAAALRRGEVIEHILWAMRREVMAPRMMRVALESVARALGAEGCAVIDVLGNGLAPTVSHEHGQEIRTVLPEVARLMESWTDQPVSGRTADGRPVLLCASQTRFCAQACLAVWRAPGGRAWDDDDTMLIGSTTAIVRVILEHDSIQQEMARQARSDPLTGLLNRRAFLDEAARRIDRLEREGLPGTLMFVDLDNFKSLNDRHGHDRGDEALRAVANLLRATVRPGDLIARFGGDEFVLWLDGMDELTAAERAEALCRNGPSALAHLGAATEEAMTMSIGIATRWPALGEDVDSMLSRSDRIMYEVKRSGRGNWRVARADCF